MNTLNESEKKRIQSVREKKLAFKARAQIMRQALNNVDTKNGIKNKKIIFNDDDDNDDVAEQNPKIERKKNRELFDDNEDEDEPLWNDDQFSLKKNDNVKTILGNDARFILDYRFKEVNHKTEETDITEDIGEYDMQKEKEKQLDILENILGVPFAVKNEEVKPAKKKVMIRYDPTKNGHHEYEVKSMESEIEEKDIKKKKTKRDRLVPTMEETISVEVSKDVYYTVSDTLTESLKQKEDFSLLKVHGREMHDTDVKDIDTSTTESRPGTFTFNFNAKNAFKYDSSDNEDVNKTDIDKQVIDENEGVNNVFEYKDTLFFDDNDVRFNEAVRFFNQEAMSDSEFKNLRRELKMIVRTKIRKNERRQQPWGKKRNTRIKKS